MAETATLPPPASPEAPPASAAPVQPKTEVVPPTPSVQAPEPVVSQREDPPEPLGTAPPVIEENTQVPYQKVEGTYIQTHNPQSRFASEAGLPASNPPGHIEEQTFINRSGGRQELQVKYKTGEWVWKDGKWLEPGPGWIDRMTTRVTDLWKTKFAGGQFKQTAKDFIDKAVATGQITLITMIPSMDKIDVPVVPPSEASLPGLTEVLSQMPPVPVELQKPVISDKPSWEEQFKQKEVGVEGVDYIKFNYGREAPQSVEGLMKAQLAIFYDFENNPQALQEMLERSNIDVKAPEQSGKPPMAAGIELNVADPRVNQLVGEANSNFINAYGQEAYDKLLQLYKSGISTYSGLRIKMSEDSMTPIDTDHIRAPIIDRAMLERNRVTPAAVNSGSV